MGPVGSMSPARLIEELDCVREARSGPCSGLFSLKDAGPHKLTNVI